MLVNFLQRGFNPPPPNGVNPAVVIGGIVGGCIGLALLLGVLATLVVVLVRSMQALQVVRKRNRSMEPGMVWLSLIPLFGIVWMFMIVTKTAEALEAEFDDRRMRKKGDSGRSAGMTYATLTAVNLAVGFVGFCVPFVGCFNLILGIVQVVFGFQYAGKLKAATQRLRDDDDQYDDDDEADDEPKRRPKPKKLADDDFEEFDEPGDNPPKGGR